MDLFWIQTCQQSKVAGDHKPLDMMCVAMSDCLANGLRQAMHVGLTRPVKCGQGSRGVKRVALHIFGASVPVNAADIFAPANDLPNKAFGGVNRNLSRLILRLNRAAQLKRVNQARIDIR